MEISEWISQWAACTPEKVAVRFDGRSLTYRELEGRVARLAGALVAAGVAPGDRVAYLGPSCPEILEALFSCARMGALLVPLNGRMPAPELAVFTKQSEPRLLLAEVGFEATARACVDNVVLFNAGEGIAAGTRVERGPASSDGRAGVLILFTSGTTGTPKGAVLTNDAVTANAVATVTALQMSAADEVLTFTPMFHIAGLNLLTLPALLMGGTVTVHRDFDPGRLLRDISAGSVTLLLCPPPLTRQLVGHPDWQHTSLRRLRCVLTGGTTVTEAAVRPWRDRGVPVVQGYGMTEAGTNVTLVPLPESRSRSLTAGKPTLGSRVRVLAPSGRDVVPGDRGEIVVQTPSMMREYWNNPGATSTAVPDGWLRTGDLGWLDAEGYLHVVDRLKEVIIVGTSNVYPADLEAVLTESPDIAAAAVVGRVDAELGEVPVAFVVAAQGRSLTEEEVLALFDGRLAPYKRPREVNFLEALPRTSVGKPRKGELRALASSGASS